MDRQALFNCKQIIKAVREDSVAAGIYIEKKMHGDDV